MSEETDGVGVKLWNGGLTLFYSGSPEAEENGQEKCLMLINPSTNQGWYYI